MGKKIRVRERLTLDDIDLGDMNREGLIRLKCELESRIVACKRSRDEARTGAAEARAQSAINALGAQMGRVNAQLSIAKQGFIGDRPTLRDQFAMAALPAVVPGLPLHRVAQWAYGLADAMLEAREEAE